MNYQNIQVLLWPLCVGGCNVVVDFSHVGLEVGPRRDLKRSRAIVLDGDLRVCGICSSSPS